MKLAIDFDKGGWRDDAKAWPGLAERLVFAHLERVGLSATCEDSWIYGVVGPGEGIWLGRRDSNPNKQSQSLLSYR